MTRWAFTAATFVSATLLFLVQPMVTKMLLPELGGSAAVWNTASVFFQAALLGGYAFAHLSLRQLGTRRQPWLQVAIVVVSLALLPVALPDGWSAPASGTPIAWTLAVLAAMVGLPFFVLSTVSPTLQRWFSTTDDPHAGDPYFLYAAGNIGSLLALLGYPLLIEPRVGLDTQARAWAAGYGLFALLLVTCAVITRRRPAAEATRVAASPPLSATTRLRWIGFAAVPSALMLGVTRHISSEVAAMPLLWVAPLAIYLGTFVVAFGRRPDRAVDLSSRALKLLVVPLALSMYGLLSSLPFSLALNLAVFAAAAMVAHGRLSQERPPADRLTEFYLLLSVGGVVGGAAAALVAPLVFATILEYPLFVVASLALLPASAFDEGVPSRSRAALVGAAVLATALGAIAVRSSGTQEALQAAMLVAGAGAALAYVLSRTSHAFALGLGTIIAVGVLVPANETTFSERTFYGVHRVYIDQANGDRRVLLNGSTVHGMEYPSGDHAGKPTTYYHPSGPIGRWFEAHAGAGPRQIDVIGLGSGALGAYGRPGDRLAFYEIDAAVADLAQRPDLFTFLSETQADVDIEIGDGRLLVERADPGRADALVVDAFSGDSIPAHLMTVEAVDLYLDRLADDGAIVFHISNRFFDFRPVLAALAEHHGLVAHVSADRVTPEQEAQGKLESTWVVLAREDDHTGIAGEPGWAPLVADRDAPLWTDQRSDLLTLMR